MEPLFYNPNLGGWWGSSTIDDANWELEERKKTARVSLIRRSAKKRESAKEMYEISKLFANEGITHVIDITTGWEDEQGGRIASYDELSEKLRNGRRGGKRLQFSRKLYNSMVRSLPKTWTEGIQKAAEWNVTNSGHERGMGVKSLLEK